MWRMPAEQKHEGFGAPDSSASQWGRQQQGGFGGPLGPTPQQKLPAEQQQRGASRPPASEWEPAAEHQAGRQQWELRQPDGGAPDRGRLHEPQAEGWGQPGPLQQQQQQLPQALRASKPRPGGHRDRQPGAEQRERSTQPPSGQPRGAWDDAGNQPSAGLLSGKSLPPAAHSVHGLWFLGRRQGSCHIAPCSNTPVHANGLAVQSRHALVPRQVMPC